MTLETFHGSCRCNIDNRHDCFDRAPTDTRLLQR